MCFPWGMVQKHENQNMKLSLAQEIFFFESHFQVRGRKEFVPWQSDLQHLATVKIPSSEHQSNQFVSQFSGGFPSESDS